MKSIADCAFEAVRLELHGPQLGQVCRNKRPLQLMQLPQNSSSSGINRLPAIDAQSIPPKYHRLLTG